MKSAETFLVIGSLGQIGTELVERLQKIYGDNSVIASDINEPPADFHGIYEKLDVMDDSKLIEIIKKHKITQVYLLAALLSATAEKKPLFAWDLNMNGLFNILNLAKEGHIKKVYWPSSIAVFGPTTPRHYAPQHTITEPTTVYGISKLAGERWCEYYFQKYNVDVRCLRYPGLISYKSAPGGGTTDYAVNIFHEAINKGTYECFLDKDTTLPMMYMPDAIDATIGIMETEAEKIKIRSGYNIAAISFTPSEIANEIKTHLQSFSINYQPDFRQAIANSWPATIDDSQARKDWNWQHKFDLSNIVSDMLKNLHKIVKL
jgi:nucleoside-diphosphate-sugar epimerase